MSTKEVVVIRLPIELKEELAKEAQRLGYSLNTYISMLVEIGRSKLLE